MNSARRLHTRGLKQLKERERNRNRIRILLKNTAERIESAWILYKSPILHESPQHFLLQQEGKKGALMIFPVSINTPTRGNRHRRTRRQRAPTSQGDDLRISIASDFQPSSLEDNTCDQTRCENKAWKMNKIIATCHSKKADSASLLKNSKRRVIYIYTYTLKMNNDE